MTLIEASTVGVAEMFSSVALREARSRVYRLAKVTPLKRVGPTHLQVKCEQYQAYGSFKVRGAASHVLKLPRDLRKPIATVSSGNHARAVAYAAQARGLDCHLFLPGGVMLSKVDFLRAHFPDFKIDVVNRHVSDLESDVAEDPNLHYVPAYDNVDVILGQASVGFEILERAQRPPACIFVPLGGGGLLAGVAAAVRSLGADTKIFGVEPSARREGYPEQTICDGARVPRPGSLNQRLIDEYVDGVVGADDSLVRSALRELGDHSLRVEPTSALSLAGLRKLQNAGLPYDDHECVIVATGGNIDRGQWTRHAALQRKPN